MTRSVLFLSALLTLGAAPALAGNHGEAAVNQAPAPGQPAPDFTLTDTTGAEHSLASQRGKIVVLEWYNPDCPFVKQAHGEGGALRTLGNAADDQGAVWWAINSGAEGKQGAGQARNAASLEEYGIEYPILLDPTGEVGRLYGAKTTPQMVIIDAEGRIAFAGAVDNAPLGDTKGSAKRTYLADALKAVRAGETPKPQAVPSYGCSVKY